jgi:hypothetical protein
MVATQRKELKMNAQVEIIKFAAFYNEGARGLQGGAAQNDKVWGVAKVGSTLVNFWGRRNGKLKFKTFLKSQEGKVMAKYEEKIGGRTDGGDIYAALNPSSEMVRILSPKLKEQVVSHYYSDMSRGKLNTTH